MSGFNQVSSVQETNFKPLEHYGAVTALKIHKTYIIAGYGPTLKIFDSSLNFLPIFSRQIFGRNKIHSISVSSGDDQKILIAGGRSFAVLNLNNLEDIDVNQTLEHAINEWIVCGQFLDQHTLLVLTAHNIIFKINPETFEFIEKIHCNEKSILYSGSIRITDSGRVIIAAGTVMSGVLIWDYHTREVLYNLTEHEGSIFGVKVDPSANFIISCSDDRSIKLYDFHTGKLLSTGWGHGSRIWNLEFCTETNGTLRLFSTGEDCTARLWEYSGSELLKLVSVMDCHLGKHVWSGDIDDKSLELCVTGGADGRIIIHDLSPETSTINSVTASHTMDNIAQQTGATFEKKELIKQYCELPLLNVLVILTSKGKIFTLNQASLKWTQCKIPQSEEKLGDFGLMKSFPDANAVVATSRNGDILVISFGESDVLKSYWIEDKYLLGNKVANLIIESSVAKNEYYVLIDCPNPKSPLVLRTFRLNDGTLELLSTTLLQQPDQLSFTTTCMWKDEVNNWLLLGSRYVSVAIYDLNSDKNKDGHISLGQIFKKLSIGDTITSVSIISAKKETVRFLMTVRDGVYMYIDILYENGDFQLNIIHHNKISRGFVEGGFIENNDLILFGFRSSYFYIFNESQQLEITNELCGGAHRQWEFLRYKESDPLDFKFIYINKSTLHIKCFQNRFHKVAGVTGGNIINYGTHGREIRYVSVSPDYQGNSSGSTRLIMTASEDTIVRLGRIHSDGKIESFWCLNGHISGLQKVKFFTKEYAASSAANEEFCLWKINESGDIPLVVEFARLKPSSSNPDLRIMDFDAIPQLDERGQVIGFILCTVYSDSNIKVWYFDVSKKSFDLLVVGNYTTCCILNVHFLTIEETTFLMTGATDGHLALWDIGSLITGRTSTNNALGNPIIKQQLHQSGIKAVLLLNKKENDYYIVTGGDDNALILSKLTYRNEKDGFLLEAESFIERAASATITSISKLDDSNVIVTSVDQIVRRWTIQEDSSLICTSARYTTIADTGCSDVAHFDGKSIAVIGGAGLSSWECK